MANLYIPARGEVKGPWLLSTDELEALDKALDIIQEKIDEAAERQIVSEAQIAVDKKDMSNTYPDLPTAIERMRERYSATGYSSYKKNRVIKLTSYDDKELTDASLKSIIRDSRNKDLSPKLLSVEINNINNSFKLDITRRYDGEISYSAKCFDQSTEDAVIYEITLWLDKYKPSKPLQIWGVAWFIFAIFGLIFGIYLLGHVITYSSYDYTPQYKQELHQLLTKGITDENRNKALELYMKFFTEYSPPSANMKAMRNIDKPLLRTSIILILIAIASIFRPKTTIGIGRHKRLVGWYRNYIKIIFVIIPSSIFLPPLYSFIRQLMGF